MFVRLTTIAGPAEGRTLEVPIGTAARVGRLVQGNQLSVPDRFFAPTHFVIEHGADACLVRDASVVPQRHPYCEAIGCFQGGLRNSTCSGKGCAAFDVSAGSGVYLNGKKIDNAPLKAGDVIAAGASCFRIEMSEAGASAGPPLAPVAANRPLQLNAPQLSQALAFLAAQQQPTYAVIDAARSIEVLNTVRSHGELYFSLYDGPEGDALSEVAPYLVSLPAGSPLREALVREHWGESRFLLLFADADFKTVRRQLRRFLTVEDEQGKQMYFRFYDPRVLREFLPSCTPAECAEFFGPISWFVIETEQPGVAQGFSWTRAGTLRTESVPF